MKKKEIFLLCGILLLALLVRLYALAYLPKKLLSDDDCEYNYIALNIGKALIGEPLEDKDKFLDLSASRGFGYPLFIASVYKIAGVRTGYVRLFQALIDSITCILVYFLATGIFNRKTALLSALLASVYPGFIYYSTMLYQETTTLFLLVLLALLIHCAISQKKVFLYFIIGMLVVFLSFYRSGFILFFFLISAIIFLVLWRQYKKQFMNFFYSFLTGALCVFILYGAFTYRVTGSMILNGPPSAWLFYETLYRDGWVTDTFAPSLSPELQQSAQKKGLSLTDNFKYTDLPSEVYMNAGMMLILKDPIGMVSQLIKRIHRMWFYVATYPERWHSRTVLLQLGFHRILLLLGLCGMVLSFLAWRSTWFFYALFFYCTVVYIPILGIPRYAIPSMPFIIILAAYTLTLLRESVSTTVNLRTKTLSAILAVLAAIAVYNYGIPGMLSLFSGVLIDTCRYAQIIAVNLLIIVLAWIFYCFIINNRKNVRTNFCLVAFPAAVLLLFYSNDALSSKTWHEWEVGLRTGNQKIKQTIVLSDDFDIQKYKQATLMIDMFPGEERDYNFIINVNGQEVKFFKGGVKVKEHKFDHKFLGIFKRFFFDSFKLNPEDFRQWYEIDLPLELISYENKAVIECGLDETSNGRKNHVTIFGDYFSGSDKNIFEGPCFPRSNQDTSLAKIMPYSGDNRFERKTVLSSAETISEYYNGMEWRRIDLSDCFGVQKGTYRIRIELIDKDGSQTIL